MKSKLLKFKEESTGYNYKHLKYLRLNVIKMFDKILWDYPEDIVEKWCKVTVIGNKAFSKNGTRFQKDSLIGVEYSVHVENLEEVVV